MQATTQKIWQRWVTWRDGSDNGRIFQAMLIVGGGTLVVNLTAFLRELAIAYQFGTSDELDAFIIAFMIPLFTISMIPGSLNPAFVPAYVNIKETQGDEAAARLAGNILSSTLILTIGITAVLIATSEYLLPAVANNFSEGKLALTLRLFYILQPILLIRAVVDLLRGVLNSQDRFALPAMAPALIYVVPTILILISGNVFLLAIGTLVGYTLQAILLWVMVARKNIKIRWQRPRLNRELKSFWGQYLPAVFGSLIMGSSNLIDQTMATWSGSGSVASLGYGQRVTTFVVGIAVMAVGTAVLPNFSKMIAENRVQEVKRTLSFYTLVLFTSTVVIVGGLWWFSEPITRILFERGAFTAADTAVVSRIQTFYLLQIPWYVIGIMFVRLISAMKQNQFLTYGAVINVLVNIGGNLLFMKLLGLAGIALSTSLVYLVSCGYLAVVAWWLLKKRAIIAAPL